MPLLVTNVPWPGEDGNDAQAVADTLQVPVEAVRTIRLLKRTVDARRRPPVWLANYRVEVADEETVLGRGLHGVREFTERDEQRHAPMDVTPPRRVPWPAEQRTIVVGAGPAGLFAALRLAEAGGRVVVLERGNAVEQRHYDVREQWRHKKLDPESNVVFGEGGAGAFSDGKIYTRRRDGELGYVFRRLVDFGADPTILEEGWAHLGTDRIREILPQLRARLIELGAEVRFGTRVSGLLVEGGRCVGVRLADEELVGGPVLLATGHSARDTYSWVVAAGAPVEARAIHIGARIEHPQKQIDRARYGGERGDLPAASYRLTSNPRDARRAHTFCMCPGGTVVPASNHPGQVVVNGMSYSKRQAYWANSAVIVEVPIADYGASDPLAGLRYQEAIETRAFQVGGGTWAAPAQLVSDLLGGRASTALPRTSYPHGVAPADLRDVFSGPIVEGLASALRFWDRKLPGFAGPEALLIAPETRTTAPLRIVRDNDTLESPGLPGLMPLGEGAGYAGGIASAALDGVRAAMQVIAAWSSG